MELSDVYMSCWSKSRAPVIMRVFSCILGALDMDWVFLVSQLMTGELCRLHVILTGWKDGLVVRDIYYSF